jgi:two-component system cell cycle response regulator
MAHPRPLVLVADDDRVTRAIVSSWLTEAGYGVVAAPDGEQALQLAAEHDPDLLLVDVTMPGLDGYDVCRAIQAAGATAPPVIFLTAHTQVTARVAGLDAGAVDYIVKPFDHTELIARVRAALRSKSARDEFHELATRDALTGLLNRRQLDALADGAIEVAKRYGRDLACLMIDLDRFKSVNDTYGHAAGDIVLREAARRFTNCIRGADILGRYGGEEFVLLLPETSADDALLAAEKLRSAITASPFDLDTLELGVSTSIGVATWTDGMASGASLYAAADEALYRAKELGRDRVELFESGTALTQ